MPDLDVRRGRTGAGWTPPSNHLRCCIDQFQDGYQTRVTRTVTGFSTLDGQPPPSIWVSEKGDGSYP